MKEYKYIIDGKEYKVAINDVVDNIANVTVNGDSFQIEMEKEAEPEKKKVVLGKAENKAEESETTTTSAANVNTDNAVKAPLPGVIRDIPVAVGDTVVVLEAMKMANNLEAEKAGKVTAILVKVGENVLEDTALVVIE